MLHGAEQFLDRIDSWKRRNAAEQSSSCIEQIPGKYEMLQSTAAPRQNRFLKKRKAAEHSSSWIEYILEKRGCCRADQFLDRKIPGKDGMLQSSAVPGQNRFLEKTGCCIGEQFLDRIDSWKRQDAIQQKRSWSRVICGRERKLFYFQQKYKRNPLYCVLKCK